MTKYLFIGNTGTGKTLSGTCLAYIFVDDCKRKKLKFEVFGNLHLTEIENFTYTPFGVFPYSKFEKNIKNNIYTLLFLDDLKSLDNLKQFEKIVASASRKANIDIVITVQYYTMASKELREMCEYEIKPTFMKDEKRVVMNCTDLDGNYFNFSVNKVDECLYDKYDTKQIVLMSNDRKLLQEIVKFSENYDDLETNLSLFFSTTKYNKYLKQIVKENEKFQD